MATKKLLNITIFVLLFNLCDDGSDRIEMTIWMLVSYTIRKKNTYYDFWPSSCVDGDFCVF